MKTISIALLMSIFTAFCVVLLLQCPGGNCAMGAQAKIDEGECEKPNQLEETIEYSKENIDGNVNAKCGEVDNRTLRERIKDAAWDLSQKASDLGHMVKEKMGEKYEGLKETITWGKEEGEHELNKAGEKVGERVEEKMDDEDDRTLAQRISDAARELSEKAYALGRMGKEKTGEQYENLKETVSMGKQKGAEKGEEARKKVGEKVEEVEEAVDDRTIRQRISDAASDLSEKASELGRLIKDKTGEKYEDLKETIGLGQQEGKEKLEEAKEKVGQKVEEGKERVGGKVKEGKEKMGEKVEEGSEDARTYAQRIGDAARELSERAAELGRMAKDKTGEKYEDLKETIGLGQQEGKEKYEKTKQKVGQKVEEGKGKLEEGSEDARTYAQRIGDAARDINERTAELGRMVKDKAGEKYENLKETIGLGQKHEEAIEAGKKIGGKVQEKIGDGEDNRTIREKINDAARELSEKTFELGQMLKGKVGEKYEEMKDALGQQQEENERSGAFHEDGECDEKASNAYSSVSKSAGQAAEYARQRALEALKSAQEYLEQSDPEAKMQPSAEKSMAERVMDGMRSARDAVADAAKSLGGKVVGAEEAPLKHDVPQTPVVHEHENAAEGSEGKGIGSRVSEGFRKAREAVVSAGQRLMETVGDGIVRVGDDAAVVP